MRFSSRVCVKRVVELDPFTRPMLQHPKHIKQPPSASRITLELPSLSLSRERESAAPRTSCYANEAARRIPKK